MEPERNGDILIRASYATDHPDMGREANVSEMLLRILGAT